MPSLPSEINGRLVLNIYSHFKGQPGRTLISKNFLAVASRRNIGVADLQSGIDYATTAGWIAEEPSGALRLTERGFERMRAG